MLIYSFIYLFIYSSTYLFIFLVSFFILYKSFFVFLFLQDFHFFFYFWVFNKNRLIHFLVCFIILITFNYGRKSICSITCISYLEIILFYALCFFNFHSFNFLFSHFIFFSSLPWFFLNFFSDNEDSTGKINSRFKILSKNFKKNFKS